MKAIISQCWTNSTRMTFRVLNLSSIPQTKNLIKKKKNTLLLQVKNGKNMTKQRINLKNLDQYQAA